MCFCPIIEFLLLETGKGRYPGDDREIPKEYEKATIGWWVDVRLYLYLSTVR